MLALICEAIHDEVHKDDLQPMVDKIIDLYISEQASNENLTIAINAMREMAERHGSLFSES